MGEVALAGSSRHANRLCAFKDFEIDHLACFQDSQVDGFPERIVQMAHKWHSGFVNCELGRHDPTQFDQLDAKTEFFGI